MISNENIEKKNYLIGKIKTLEVIEKIFIHLQETNSLNLWIKALNQIEKAPDSPMGERLAFGKQYRDQYWWEGVRTSAQQAKNEWLNHQNVKLFKLYLKEEKQTQNNLLAEFESKPSIEATNKIINEYMVKIKQLEEKIETLTIKIDEISELTSKKWINNVTQTLKKEFTEIMTTEIQSYLNNFIETSIKNKKSSTPSEISTNIKAKLKEKTELSPQTTVGEITKKVIKNKRPSKNYLNQSPLSKTFNEEELASLTLKDALKILRDEE